ncbi:HTH-type transcriptional regulator YesS [Paenibacillus konkukensis]|uniref:HTH-type transcriptional regulator YesS n=1 Tax=Paenibacillus konkukensis TaxID=2020716 RepID=A0ABY4RKN5_9BACL|nr:helix-turn-helix domain-containing protein [Paenibacillus konkukensis]UQZ83067.1 HTH-type transcriptional regulator YesS [Paenibacillus konkukensis]
MISLIQSAFSNFKFRSLFFRILFIQIVLVAMTAAVVGFLGERYSQNVVRDEVTRSSMQVLEQTRRLMDVLLNEVDQITIRLAQNMAFSRALEAGLEGPAKPDTDTIHDMMLESYISSPYIESISVYYARSGLMQSALTGLTKVADSDDPEWFPLYASMHRTEGRWFVRPYSKTRASQLNETQVTLIRTTPWVGTPINGAVIVNLNQQALFQSPSIHLIRPGEEIWMVSPDASLAYNITTGAVVSDKEFAVVGEHLTDRTTAFTSHFRNADYSFTALTSPYSGWKYVNLIPTVSLYKSGKAIQSFMLILMVFSIGIAGVFAFFISLKIYSPIYSLVQLVNTKKEERRDRPPDGEKSEVTMLFDAFHSLKEKGSELEVQLRDNWPVLQQSFLQQLIQEQPLDAEERLAKFAYYRLPVTRHGFFVCVLRIDNYASYVKKYSSLDQSSIRYFIAKAGSELAGGAFRSYPLHTESRDMILICNLEAAMEREDFRERAEAVAASIVSSIDSYLKLSISVGVGDLKESAADIGISYQEAVEALEHRAFKGGGLVAPIWMQQARGPADHQFFRKLGEAKRELLLHLRSEQPDRLEEALERLYELALQADGLSFPLLRHSLFQLVVDVFQRASELGLEPSRPDMELSGLQEQMQWLETVEQAVRFVRDYVGAIHRQLYSNRAEEPPSVARQILDYIQLNFDKDISLGGIADQLKLDPSYVSRLFRQEISMTFTDYVLMLRLAKAKELLQHSKLAIKEIGALVGYANQRSFNRIFKKYEGVTPGEYRDIHAPSKLAGDQIY